jgi:hypothetical protein
VTPPSGELAITTTGQDGTFFARSNIGPVGTASACVTVRVRPAAALSLADTVASGVVVTMRPNLPGVVLDTATVMVTVRAR